MLVQAAPTWGKTPVKPLVIVVDDEPAFAEAVAELLSESFDARPFSSPEEALLLTRNERCDVALIDLTMPGMSGLDLAERVREHSPCTEVVILTGRDDLEAARGGLQVGAYDFLLKSGFNAVTLEGTVRSAAEKAQRVRAQVDLVKRLGEANRLLAALQGLGAADGTPLDSRAVLGRLLAAAKDLTGAAAGRALSFAPTHSEEGLVVEEAVGDGAEPLLGARLGPSEGIATIVALLGESVQVASVADHPRYSHKCDELPTGQPGFLCVPLRSGPFKGALTLAGPPSGAFSAEAVAAAERLAAHAATHVENILNQDNAANFFTHVSAILVEILDSQDVSNQGHSGRVAQLADMVTRPLGLSDPERKNVHFAALLHDIGKTRVNPSQPGTDDRYEPATRHAIEEHVALGVEMLRPITQFAEILPIIQAHHERWDGKGYPAGLAGEDSPHGARVIAVADAFDAMTHGRPSSPGRSDEEAIGELEAGAGTQFDPLIVRLFVTEYRRHRDAGQP